MALQKANDTKILLAVEVAWEVTETEVEQIENLELQWTVNGNTSVGDFLVWFLYKAFLLSENLEIESH